MDLSMVERTKQTNIITEDKIGHQAQVASKSFRKYYENIVYIAFLF